MTTMTVSELASVFKVTPRAVRLWMDAGMPTVKRANRGEQAESLIDLEAATRWYFEVNTARLELDRQRASLASERRQATAMHNAARRADLADIREIARQFAAAVQFAHQTLLAMPPRVARAIAQSSDAAVIEALLHKEIHVRLHELANYGSGKRVRKGRKNGGAK